MATKKMKKNEACIFQWKLENASLCWWFKNEGLESPPFIADALKGTKWSLLLHLNGNRDKTYISLFLQRAADCIGPKLIEVKFHLAFLGKDGALLVEKISKHTFGKDTSYGTSSFVKRERVFFIEKEAFLPEDTLTVQCTLKNSDETLIKSNYIYGRMSLKVNRKSFNWKIKEFSTLESGARYEFKDALFNFHLVLNADFDTLDLKMIKFHDWVKYISFNVFALDSEGRRHFCGFKNYCASALKRGKSLILHFPQKLFKDKRRYLSNDVLSLDIEFVFASIEYFLAVKNFAISNYDTSIMNEWYVGEKKYQNAALLFDNFKSMYNEAIFADTELRTSTKVFKVHKAILSARSPVFRRMLSSDMKEANCGHIDIVDFEEDTVHRMLLYMYAGTLEDLQFESAFELYKIADKYQILSLRKSCSTFLKVNICPKKVCDILILADLYQDKGLKNAVEVYSMEHEDVFDSLEWKNLMNSNPKLAGDVMHKNVSIG